MGYSHGCGKSLVKNYAPSVHGFTLGDVLSASLDGGRRPCLWGWSSYLTWSGCTTRHPCLLGTLTNRLCYFFHITFTGAQDQH